MFRFAAASCFVFLTGCSIDKNKTTLVSNHPAFPGYPLQAVLLRVKQEVGVFMLDDIATRARWNDYLSTHGGSDGCSKGRKLSFQITTIKMTFRVVIDSLKKANASAQPPIGPTGFTAGPSVMVSNDFTDTQELTYYYYPKEDPDFIKQAATDPTIVSARDSMIIAYNLDTLRDALVTASNQRPCFRDTKATDKGDDILTFGVSIENADNGGVGIKFVPAGLGAEASYQLKKTTGNTIVVTFKPVNT